MDNSKEQFDLRNKKRREELLEELQDRMLPELSNALTLAIRGKNADGLTPTQLFLLIRIAEGYDTVSELAKYFGISPSAVSKMVETLVQADCLTRVRSQEDRRIAQLELTDHGKVAMEKTRKVRKEVFREVCSVFSSDELIQFTEMFNKLLSWVKVRRF